MSRLLEFVGRLVRWWRGDREIRPTPLTTKPPEIGAPTLTENPRKLSRREKKRRERGELQ